MLWSRKKITISRLSKVLCMGVFSTSEMFEFGSVRDGVHSAAQLTGLIQNGISCVPVQVDLNIFKLRQFYIIPISSMGLKDLCRSRYAPFSGDKALQDRCTKSHMAGRHL